MAAENVTDPKTVGSLETFLALRPRLMALAYRMLGAAGDAEDMVQEAWLRWQATDATTVQSPRAWLATTVSRLCLDRLKSAPRRHESYVGPWMPEPVATSEPVDLESVSLAFLVVLERLSPVERAVYLMHHVFDFAHAEIAAALDMTEVAVRQAFHRARKHVTENRPRFAPSQADHRRMLEAFLAALLKGEMAPLLELLARDATLHADSGGKVRGAATRPVEGGEHVARFLLGVMGKWAADADLVVEITSVNGWPALVARAARGVVVVMNIETDGQHIFAVRNLINPDKLRLPPVD